MHNSMENEQANLVRTYSIRRVNPFLGVMQVIAANEGRALSCNGVVWEILVRADQGTTLDSLEQDDTKKTYYRFGMWSMQDGLMKRSNSPAEDQDYYKLEARCEVLVGYAQDHHTRLPFKLEDTRELWLFDKNNQKPLALLSSLLPDSSLPSPAPNYWSACIGANGSPSQRRFPHARELEAQVSQRAGFNINKHWISRKTHGDGIVDITKETIPAKHFPTLLLNENWNNEEERLRVCEYIKWISPSLLTLQHLNDNTRTRLENNLNIQAVSIEHHWHLYPQIINQKLLKAARVQSRIEKCR